MSGHTQSTHTWITQFYLQITPCLPFVLQAFTRWHHNDDDDDDDNLERAHVVKH